MIKNWEIYNLIFVAYAYRPRFDGRTKTGYKDNIKPGFFVGLLSLFYVFCL
jgi:hypothetical protein